MITFLPLFLQISSLFLILSITYNFIIYNLYTMPPYMIFVLMISSSALLLVLLFVLRKKNRNKEFMPTDTSRADEVDHTPERTPELRNDVNPVLDDLSSINLDSLGSLEHMSQAPLPSVQVPLQATETLPPMTNHLIEESESSPKSELIELIKRYNFLAGENLDKFCQFLENDQFSDIEQLIKERFQAQGKENADQLAKTTTEKLLSTLPQT